ncbi:MAG: hypothetical protein COU08_04680 [Candidatus Harrisonbacteria bacterium CG10_big_fil_rev_8_21_14_0_10_42_17]|uniref:RNA polymerase sigma-70 domain-containing protein n=1 Tax=Candidatus Harrisonbacteria bacterium CG10_big_fil_rev_8_21_14_0_10_42_17 TaxID=1974584 RepID=A0A2M6WH50_9BACT|nr:MAG: hypothetical protein COU08_04680 [Candidatus Harrisonbacteria bacterium CG10_big_fil_rev_8_21_14_0_10_42_17]
MKEKKAELHDLWEIYRRDKTNVNVRNKLLTAHLPIVRRIIGQLCKKMPCYINEDDLYSAGIFGLIDAIKNFDARRGVTFKAYCHRRIRGSVFDELRGKNSAARRKRDQVKKINRARRQLEEELGREPMECELAEQTETSPNKLREIEREANALRNPLRLLGSPSPKRELKSCNVPLLEFLEDKRCQRWLEETEHREFFRKVYNALSRIEKLIIILYYYDELTFKEIGNILKLSESRISQIHAQIIKKIRHLVVKK